MFNYSNAIENSEKVEHYLKYISNIDLSSKQKFELLYVVRSILSHFVDQAFNVQTDQITLQSISNGSNASLGHATIENYPDNQTNDVLSNDVERDSNPIGSTEP
jgi:hypothetical protein